MIKYQVNTTEKLLLVILLISSIVISSCSRRDEIDVGRSQDNFKEEWSEIEKHDIAKFSRAMDSTYPSIENRNLKVKAGKIEGSNLIVVYMVSSTWCGSGSCNLIFARKVGDEYKEIGIISGAQLPIRKIDANINGFPAIGVWSRGLGESPSYERIVAYDGMKFIDSDNSKDDRPFSQKQAETIIGDSEKYIFPYKLKELR